MNQCRSRFGYEKQSRKHKDEEEEEEKNEPTNSMRFCGGYAGPILQDKTTEDFLAVINPSNSLWPQMQFEKLY